MLLTNFKIYIHDIQELRHKIPTQKNKLMAYLSFDDYTGLRMTMVSSMTSFPGQQIEGLSLSFVAQEKDVRNITICSGKEGILV